MPNFQPVGAGGNVWMPQLSFTVDDDDIAGSRTFLAGLAYGLDYSNKMLLARGKENFYCLDATQTIGLKEILDILNPQLEGIISSEEVVGRLMIGLTEKYNCR